jgi:hypothetical protein
MGVAIGSGMSVRVIEELRKRFVTYGIVTALRYGPRGHRPPFLDGDDEANLIVLACGQTEDGVKGGRVRGLVEKSKLSAGDMSRVKPFGGL